LIDQAKIEVHGIDITKPITKGELLNFLYNSIKNNQSLKDNDYIIKICLNRWRIK